MDTKKLFEIWDRFEVSSASELELEMEGARLVLKKNAADRNAVYSAMSSNSASEINSPVAESDAYHGKAIPSYQNSSKGNASTPDANLTEIRCPFTGTFYAAASPDADPYVKAGDSVQKGQIVGILEAMKMMNEITASESGIVEEICCENGTLCEYNTVLFKIRKGAG